MIPTCVPSKWGEPLKKSQVSVSAARVGARRCLALGDAPRRPYRPKTHSQDGLATDTSRCRQPMPVPPAARATLSF
jgi:hypothetical protein